MATVFQTPETPRKFGRWRKLAPGRDQQNESLSTIAFWMMVIVGLLLAALAVVATLIGNGGATMHEWPML